MIARQITMVACAILLAGAAQAGPTAEQKCQQAKLKVQAKLLACLKKNDAKLIGGGADGSAKCLTKFQEGLAKANSKAAAAGASCRYADGGNGTVSDLDTGLTWEQKTNADLVANAGDPHDADNLYTWSTSGAAPDGTAFTAFLAALNDNGSSDGAPTAVTGCFAGYCDWRLPTIVELQTIADPALCGPQACLNEAFGPRPTYSFYWTSTTVAGTPTKAWDERFGSSSLVYTWDKTNTNWVRAVRGGLPLSTVAPASPTPTPTPIPGCTMDSDCPATGNECVVPVCSSGVCDTQNLGFAHALSSGQTTGDCQELVCDGAGGVTSIDNSGDVPTSFTVCKAAMCVGPPPLHAELINAPAGTDCSADNSPPNHVCGDTNEPSVAGKCVECNTNADCSFPQTCNAFLCQ